MKKVIILLLVLSGTAAIAYTLYNNKATMNAETEKAMLRSEYIPVATEKVTFRAIKRDFEANGVFEAHQELTLMAETSGKVVNILKKKGDYVKKGDLILQIDDRLIKSEQIVAALNIEQQEKDFKRFSNLAETDAITKKQLEDSERALKIAKAQFEAINKRVEDTQIKAPISGYINEDFYEPGVLVSPGMPLANIINKNPLKLTVKVSENEVSALKIGQTLPITVNALPQEKMEGTVAFISDKADGAFKYEVTLVVKNKEGELVKPGMFGTALFSEAASDEKLVISRQAIAGGLKNPGVFTITDGKAVFRPIEIRSLNASEVEVISGLESGEQIITTGLINVKEGIPVKAL